MYFIQISSDLASAHPASKGFAPFCAIKKLLTIGQWWLCGRVLAYRYSGPQFDYRCQTRVFSALVSLDRWTSGISYYLSVFLVFKLPSQHMSYFSPSPLPLCASYTKLTVILSPYFSAFPLSLNVSISLALYLSPFVSHSIIRSLALILFFALLVETKHQ